MKIQVTIDVPEGKRCVDDGGLCRFIDEIDWCCPIFNKIGSDDLKKCPDCIQAGTTEENGDHDNT